jgi:predicted dienelactone hydrolase
MKSPFKSLHLFSWLTLMSISSFTIVSARTLAQDATASTFVNGDPMPDAPALAPRGDYAVGVRTLTVTNTDQVDVVSRLAGDADGRYDRTLTLEVWYPAVIGEGQIEQATYNDVLPPSADEPAIPFSIAGRALRDAAPDSSGAAYPLLVVAHGYTGSRYQLAYLSENLASKGYVVVAIDHTESTNADIGPFQSTLMNRPLDIRFTIDQIDAMSLVNDSNTSFLSGLVDANNTGLIGYSMGGYGALNVAGAGYNAVLSGFVGDFATPLLAGSADFAAHSRVKAVVALAPFGADLTIAGASGMGFWDAEGLEGISVPVFFAVGSLDDVAGYEKGGRFIFESAVNSDRYLLTFENARHNIAAAPPPAAATSYENWVRYGDSVWDNRRMNNIVQHFATAFLALHLKDDSQVQAYLDVTAGAEWQGFQPRSSVGLRLEHAAP